MTKTLIQRLERLTGQSHEEISQETLSAKRRRISQQKGKPMKFTRNYPLIGRGCVLGDNLRSTAELNREIDELLQLQG